MATSFPNITAPLVNSSGVITSPWRKFLESLWARTGGSQGGTNFASGMIIDFGGSSPPDGWLLCNGASVLRSQYSTLFGAIGTTFGAGDGVTTFNLPDFSGKISIAPTGTKPFGSSGGSTGIVLTQANLPNVNFTITDPGHAHNLTDPGHSHTSRNIAANITVGGVASGATAGNSGTATTGISVDVATTNISVNSGGSATPIDNTPPYVVVNRIIKI